MRKGCSKALEEGCGYAPNFDSGRSYDGADQRPSISGLVLEVRIRLP